MPRRVFFSFHFDNDFWRTQQVRNIRSLEGQTLCTPNAWEQVKRGGSNAIERWIDSNLYGKSCVVVLVGSRTSERPWVRREIVKGWDAGKGVLAIRIHRLLDSAGHPSSAGTNPLEKVVHSTTGLTLFQIAPSYSPLGWDSKGVYASIRDNMEDWIETAIEIRNTH
jgi:hypothetical protein